MNAITDDHPLLRFGLQQAIPLSQHMEMVAEVSSDERWLGRSLSGNETIGMNANRAHPEPPADEREILWHEIVSQSREIGSRGCDLNEEERDAPIKEAFSATRAAVAGEIHA